MKRINLAILSARLQASIDQWIGEAALGLQLLLDRYRTPKTVSLLEGAEGFDITSGAKLHLDGSRGQPLETLLSSSRGTLRGSHAEVEVSSIRFVFREIEVPSGASDLISGVVRSQIEKLMPWNIDSMVYGWTINPDSNSDHAKVLIAGCAFESVRSIVENLKASGTRSFSLSVRTPELERPIEIWNEMVARTEASESTRHRAKMVFAGAISLASLLIVADIGVSAFARPGDIAHQIKQAQLRNGQLRFSGSSSADPINYKRTGPASVLLLEEVAKLLPDDSYLTEFRVDKGKLQISGRTKDAASLLVLFGRSAELSGARFFSPSSRTGDDGAETFHIEATINPRGGAKT